MEEIIDVTTLKTLEIQSLNPSKIIDIYINESFYKTIDSNQLTLIPDNSNIYINIRDSYISSQYSTIDFFTMLSSFLPKIIFLFIIVSIIYIFIRELMKDD